MTRSREHMLVRTAKRLFLVPMMILALGAAPTADADAPADAKQLPAFIPPLPADAPAPPTDPRDLRGMWLNYSRTPAQILTAEGGKPPFSAGAAAARDAKARAAEAGRPVVNNAIMCRPPGYLWVLGLYFPVRVMQQDSALTFIFERFHVVWRVAVGANTARASSRTYMGRSVGRWEGDTLVVDTRGFRGDQWLDDLGTLVSASAHLVSRLTKRSAGTELEVVTTIDDPENYTRPWTIKQILNWRPDYLVLSEHDCEETAGNAEDAEKYGYRAAPQ